MMIIVLRSRSGRNKMTLQRKDAAKFSKSKLLDKYNDIDIYIEDTAKNYDKLYVNIFKRIFNDQYKIDNVYPIGSRGNVIKKCNEKKDNIKKPTLFVVDGDLYMLKGENELPRGVFRLPYYCIENLLLDVNAIINYIDEEHTSLREEDIVSEFSYDEWKSVCEYPLVELFIRYAMIQKLNIPSVPNVSIPIKDFLDDNDNSTIDPEKVKNKISDLDGVIVNSKGQEIFTETYQEILERMESSLCKLTTHVSGKDYLYPMIHSKVSTILSKGVSHMNFKQRLALNCDISQVIDCRNSVITPSI